MSKRTVTRALALAAATLLAACGGSDETALDTEAASESVAAIVADARDRGEPLLDRCPHDPSGESMVRMVAAAGTDAFDEAMANDSGGGILLGQGIGCDRGVPRTTITLWAGSPHDDFDAYVAAIEDEGSDTLDIIINRQASSDHRGAELRHLCVERVTEDNLQGHCEVSWFDDNLMVTIVLSSPSPADTDVEAVAEAFVAELDEIIANLTQTDG